MVVLSNNDGCIISRCARVKALEVPMGAPYFKYRRLLKRAGVTVFSSNYPLYADLSRRAMQVIRQYFPAMEVYSIDEAFVKFPDGVDVESLATTVKHILKQWIGLPVSIGIAPTKTLAKAASHVAKQVSSGIQVYAVEAIDELLSQVPLAAIWGVGRQMLQHFRVLGIETSVDLKNFCPHEMQRVHSVVYKKMVLELQGQPCLPLATPKPKKSILSSRSFSYDIDSFDALADAVSCFVSLAADKARRSARVASELTVYIKTNRFQRKAPQYRGVKSRLLDQPTNDTGHLITLAKTLLAELYRPGHRYKKAGVILSQLQDAAVSQCSLITPLTPAPRETLMKAIDAVNRRHGKNRLFFAAQGLQRGWMPHCDLRSAGYTTQWQDLLKVFATPSMVKLR